MINKIKVLLILLFINSAAYAQDCYQLIWSDEFNTDGAPDASIWGYDLGNSGFGNNEIQNYTNTSDNVRISNGVLIIEAIKTASGWTSARLKTQGKKSFTYGKIEFRAKLPAGSGTWSALWMLGESVTTVGWPACGEVDVMEHVGRDPGKVHASIHTPSSYGATINTGITTVSDFSTAFHNYVVDWTPEKMDFYVDNTLYYTYIPSIKNDATWPFDKPCFLIMNLAMGGNWGSDPRYETGGLKNGIDPSLSSARMEVDYVRYYSKTEKPIITGSTILNMDETSVFSVPQSAGFSYQWTVPADAQIISGQNTNQITVKWGATSGDVSLTEVTPCGTLSATPTSVKVKVTPTAEVYSIPALNSDNSTSWQVVQTSGNSITLASNSDLEISYDITAPANNPYLRYVLPAITDVSGYNYISFTLKSEKDNPPAVIRLDMIDIQNHNNQDNLFKTTSFVNDEQFHLYASTIQSSSTFSLAAIQELRLYLNYGIYPKGSGKVWLRNISFHKQNPLSIFPVTNKKNQITVFPNPSNQRITILPQEPYKITIIGPSGQVIKSYGEKTDTIDISALPAGVYQLIIKNKENKEFSAKFVKAD